MASGQSKRLIGWLFTLTLLVVHLTACTERTSRGLNPGEVPPEFSLPTLSGLPGPTPSDLRGNLVIVSFWASWCAPCVAELLAFKELHGALAGRGLRIVAIGTSDTKEGLEKVVRELELPFPVLFDGDGAIKDKYGVTGFPESFVITPAGKLTLFLDPASGPVVRIKGERPWSDPAYISLLENLLPDKERG